MNFTEAFKYLIIGFLTLSASMTVVAAAGSSIVSWVIFIPTCFVFGSGVFSLWRSYKNGSEGGNK